MLLAQRLKDGTLRYISGEMDSDSEQIIKSEVKPGKYIMILKAHWKSFVKIMGFSIYGPSNSKIT